MLSFRTTDTWTTGSIVVTTATFTATYTTVGPTAYDEMVNFLAWFNAGARPWTGLTTMSGWTFDRYTSHFGALLTLIFTGAVHWAPNAQAITLLGIPDQTVATVVGTTAAAGTWCPLALSIGSYYRLLDGAGDGSGVGAIRTGVTGTAHRVPTIEAVGDKWDAAGITGLAKTLASPRRAWVFDLAQPINPSWLDLSVGAINRAASDGIRYKFNVQCCGGPV